MQMRHAVRGKMAVAGVLGILGMMGCARDGGGELREATRARQLRDASADSPAAGDTLAPPITAPATDSAAADTSTYDLPVFAQPPAADTTPKSAPPASAKPAAPKPVPDTSRRPPAAPAPPPANGAQWLTAPREAKRPGSTAVVTMLYAGHNVGFDRVVLRFDGATVPSYRVGYAKAPPAQCGSGAPTSVAGAAWLVVRLTGAQAHDAAGRPTVAPRERKPPLPLIREVELTCDFEGEVTLAIGLDAARPFRVLELRNPTRLAVDVQQPEAAPPPR